MLALAAWRASRCPHCGRDIAECTDPGSEGKYTAGLPHRCHATTALLIAQDQHQETPQAGALMWHVEKR